MMDYQMFNTRVAKQCGMSAAVILQHFQFWIERNRAEDKHFHDGYYWTYASRKGLAQIFDYMTEKQIRTAIDKLEQAGYILKGNYNQSGYDRTAWYTITEAGHALFTDTQTANGNAQEGQSIGPKGPMEMPKRANGNAQKGQPIPDNKTDNKTDNTPPTPPRGNAELDAVFDRLWSIYPKKQGKAEAKKAFVKAIKKTTLDEIFSAIDCQKKTSQWQKDNGQFVPMLSTWLNQERWADEVQTTPITQQHDEAYWDERWRGYGPEWTGDE